MKKVFVLIAVVLVCRGFGQCPFPVQLTGSENNCLHGDTLMIHASTAISNIVWLRNTIVDKTLTALVVTAPLQNATTVAGGNGAGNSLNQFNSPSSLFVDAAGYVYVADRSNYRVIKFPPGSASVTNGVVIAGGNGPGQALNQFQPNAIFVDADGNLYIADDANSRVLKFPPNSSGATNGIIAAGGNGPGKDANQLVNPVSVFVDAGKNLYVVDAFNDRVQKFPPNSTSATNATTVAGGNGYGNNANQFNGPASVFVDKDGNIYVDDAANNRIQKFPPNSISATNGITIAGGNGFGAAPNQLSTPSSIWVDDAGNVYVADINNQRVQQFPPGSNNFTSGKTVAGGNGQGVAANQFSGPNAVWGDNKGNLYVSDIGNNRIQKFSTQPVKQYLIDTTYFPAQTGTYAAIVTDALGCSVTTNDVVVNPMLMPSVTIKALPNNIAACTQTKATYSFVATFVNGGDSPLYQWQINGRDTGVGSSSFTADVANKDVVTCRLTGNAVCAAMPTVFSNNLVVSFAASPMAALTNKGRLCAGIDTLVVSSSTAISTISWYNGEALDTIITSKEDTIPLSGGITVAGGVGAGAADNQLYSPASVYVDDAGTIYVADQGNQRIQKFPSGAARGTNGVTVAGGNGMGMAANQFQPASVSVDGSGTIYIADAANNRVQKFSPNSTSATNGITAAGGNGAGSAANQFNVDNSLCLDAAGNLYVVDAVNARIQKFPPNSTSLTNGITVAGGNGFGSALNQFNQPASVFVDAKGYLYVADAGNKRIQKFPPNSASITNGVTIAGGNGFGSAANQLASPKSVCVDNTGNVYVADAANNRIQKFPPNSTSATDGITIAGGNGAGSAANQFNAPTCVFIDAKGSIYIADAGNNRIQKIVPYTLNDVKADTTYKPRVAGTYKAIVTDSAGCSDTTDAVIINTTTKPGISIRADKEKICANELLTFTATPADAGSSPVYQWRVNGVASGTNSDRYSNALFSDGDTVACIISGDTSGCIGTDTSNKIVAIIKPLPVFQPANDVRISLGQSVVLNLPVSGDIINYEWQPAVWLSNPAVANPVATPLTTTTYHLHVLSADSCAADGSVKVIISSEITIPNAFTPDGDGRNDKWYVLGGREGDVVKSLAVFDRAGQKIFNVQNVLPGDSSAGWNGTYKGKQASQGAYIYIAVIVSADKSEKVYKGTVVLIR